MITFTTEFFKLDLSHLKITFSEENSLFDNDLIKQQSYPFSIPKTRSFIDFYEFVAHHNSALSNKYVIGVLYKNDTFYKAELLVLKIASTIETIIYYSSSKISIFDKPLKSLGWPVGVLGDYPHEAAKNTSLLNYPDTPYNFPQVHVPELYENDTEDAAGFGAYSGYINEVTNNEFSQVRKVGSDVFIPDPGYGRRSGVGQYVQGITFYKINELRPFLYVKHIIKHIFSLIGYTVIGDFDTDTRIQKALQYHTNSIYYTNKDVELINDDLDFELLETYTGSPSSLRSDTYIHRVQVNDYGLYKISVDVTSEIEGNGPDRKEMSLKVGYGASFSKTLFKSTGAGKEEASLTVDYVFFVPRDPFADATVDIIIGSHFEDSITGKYKITGTNMPLYDLRFYQKDLLPDITTSNYIKNIKDTFNMSTVFNDVNKTVTFNFFDNLSKDDNVVDLSKYNAFNPTRVFNRLTGYKVSFANKEIIYIDKTANFTQENTGYTNYSIPLQPLPAVTKEAGQFVEHQDGLSILFYEANNDAKPLITDANNISYTRQGFIEQFLIKGMFQKLNTEDYTLNIVLPCFLAAKINADTKIWIFNNVFLVKSLTRFSVNNLFEKLNIKLFKLKRVPSFISQSANNN